MELAFYAFANQYEPDTNPNSIAALAVAENKLMHPEICEHINLAFCIGGPGDGVLIGRPLYVGFLPDLTTRSKCVAMISGGGRLY